MTHPVHRLVAGPLTSAAFLPYGDVLEAPAIPGRTDFDAGLANLRPAARPVLTLVTKEPAPPLPLTSRVMERHRFSSQSFVPVEAGPWLVVVAPHEAVSGGPDMARARAFLARPDQGVTYGADVWHHPFTVLDRRARFAVFMWRDGTPADDEFVQVPSFEVALP
jgi:ureidoglycolate lyase